MLKTRQELLQSFAEEQSQDMFATAFEKMKTKLSENMKELPKELGTTASFAVLSVQKQIKIMITNALGRDGKFAVQEQKLKLQQTIQPVIVEWLTRWTVSYIQEDYVMSGDLRIPEDYPDINMENGDEDEEEDEQGERTRVKNELDEEEFMFVD